VYDNSSDAHLKPSTLPMFPRLPSVDDPHWRDVAVRSRLHDRTDVKRFPTDERGLEIATVHAGDTISILPDVQHGYYVSARLGYHVGWINFKHVKLISLQPRQRLNLDETKPEAPPQRDERIAQRKAELIQRAQETGRLQNEFEAETQPAPPQIERRPPAIAKSDVNRIINKLKSLGGFFSRR